MFSNRFLWTAAAILASVGAGWLMSGGSVTGWINALFMIGLVLLVIAAASFVMHGGFFNAFMKGFSKMGRIWNRRDYGFDDSPEGGDTKEERKEWAARWLIPVAFTVGLVDTALSFLLLAFL